MSQGRVQVVWQTDLIHGSRGLMPPGVYMPLTKALFPRDSLHVTFIATPLRRQRSFVDEGTEAQRGQTSAQSHRTGM